MKANFHTHTVRCRHATGDDREYVEAAIEKGLKALGFSDHTPYIFPDGYYSNYRMRPEEAEGYVRSVLSLRDEYKEDISIYLGFEAEHYPLYFADTMRFIEQYPYDYLILGQHYMQNEYGGRYSRALTSDETVLSTYVNECIEAMETGKFFYFAHPDFLHFVGDAERYRHHMERLCLAAKSHGVPLEINLLGIRALSHYPNDAFWSIAGKIGNDVILGCDAHEPSSVAAPADLEAAHTLVAKYELHLIEPLAPKK